MWDLTVTIYDDDEDEDDDDDWWWWWKGNVTERMMGNWTNQFKPEVVSQFQTREPANSILQKNKKNEFVNNVIVIALFCLLIFHQWW